MSDSDDFSVTLQNPGATAELAVAGGATLGAEHLLQEHRQILKLLICSDTEKWDTRLLYIRWQSTQF